MLKAALEKRCECEAALIAALNDESELIRRTAGEALLRLDTIQGLAAVVAGNNHGYAVRTRAAQRLKEHGNAAEAAIPALFSLINYPDINWRSHMWASLALAAIGEKAFPYLIHALHHGTGPAKYYAASALREAGVGDDYAQLIVEILGNTEKPTEPSDAPKPPNGAF